MRVRASTWLRPGGRRQHELGVAARESAAAVGAGAAHAAAAEHDAGAARRGAEVGRELRERGLAREISRQIKVNLLNFLLMQKKII